MLLHSIQSEHSDASEQIEHKQNKTELRVGQALTKVVV